LGETMPKERMDINLDGKIDSLDLSLLLSIWEGSL